VPVVILDETRTSSLDIVIALVRILKEQRIELVHTHRYKDTVLGLIAARIAGVPHAVRTMHGLREPMRGWAHLKFAVYEALEKVVLRCWADQVIAVSEDDDTIVFPSTVLRGTPEDAPYSYAFAIPNDAPGLRYLCRTSLYNGGSTHDEPLASRYEEMDAVAVFDHVFVPNERIFMLGHPQLCNSFYTETGAGALMTHQVVTRTIAKSEFFLGLASELAESIGIDGFQHIQEDIAELIIDVEIGKALVRASEADAALNDAGVMLPKWTTLNAARNWYPKMAQRFPQIIRKFSASGLMALPGEADVNSEAREDIELYLQGKTLTGPERVRLFKLAFDASISGFSGRQSLYEYFFFGDPVRMASALVNTYDRGPVRARVRELLNRTD